MRKFIQECIRPFYWVIISQVIIALFLSVDLTLRSYLLKLIVDRVELSNGSYLFLMTVLLYIFALVFSLVLKRLDDFVWMKLNSPLKKNVCLLISERMMKYSISFFQNALAGTIASKQKEAMSAVPDAIKMVVKDFLGDALALLILIITAFHVLDLQIGTVLLIWSIFFVVLSFKFSQKARHLCHISAEASSATVGLLVDILSNIGIVRLFVNQHIEKNNLEKQLDRYVKADRERDLFFIKMFSILGGSFVLYQIFCVWALFYEAGKDFSKGDLVFILTANTSILDRLWRLALNMGNFSDLVGKLYNGLSIFNSSIEIQDTASAPAISVSEGKIVFDSVSFKYPRTAVSVFNKLSVSIKGKEKVGLVGYSGVGKTTFVNLLLRLFEVTDGKILIDGQDIKKVSQDSLHSLFGVIPQDPTLFHRSIKENIRYGNLHASDNEVIEAAIKADAHDFIMNLREEYDSMVGERGVKLSGGQRQRIAMARLFLKRPSILILDEPTSSLDSITEQKIQLSLSELMKQTTALVIAHRLSTLLQMDRILVFSNEKIVQDGNHDSLIKEKGLYQSLWVSQKNGFLPQ